jgi:hypothetical protein
MMSDNTQAQEAPTQEAQAQANAELTVNDLNALKQIIDVASQRGAFKPNEMAVVGTTYTKLETFLNAVQAQQQPAQEQAQAEQGA